MVWLLDSLPFIGSDPRAAKWAAVAKRVGAERDRKHEQYKQQLQKLAAQISQSTKDKILSLNATQLADAISRGQLTSADAVTFYSWRAAQAQDYLHCNATEHYLEAIDYAKKEDERRAAERKSKNVKAGEPLQSARLLEGVPLSIKDAYIEAGKISTCGCASKSEKVYSEDGLLVKLLKDAGGVPFVRTNIPQSLMLPETDCAMWGQCENPFKAGRAAGGSSGGEGALISARGSVLGIGTDIGGSVRIPASFSGICSFKCTPQRQTIKGMDLPRKHAYDGISKKDLPNACGPMARSVDDLVTLTKCWWSEQAYKEDPYVPRQPFNDDIYKSKDKLKVGYYTYDGFFQASPGNKRAVLEAVEVLKKNGHEVTEFHPPRTASYNLITSWGAIAGADGGLDQLDGQQGETPNHRYTNNILLRLPLGLPSQLQRYAPHIWQLTGNNRLADMFEQTPLTTFHYFQLLANVQKWQDEWLAAWKSSGMDVLIVPSTMLPAIPHGTSSDLFGCVSATMLFNMLEYPAGIVPWSTVREDEQSYTDNHDDLITKAAKAAMKGSAGLPLGVQCVSLPFHDEHALRALKEIETAADFYAKNPPKVLLNIKS